MAPDVTTSSNFRAESRVCLCFPQHGFSRIDRPITRRNPNTSNPLTNYSKITICVICVNTRVGTLIVASIYLQLIQNRYMFRSFTLLQCSHQHCVQPVASDEEFVGYL